MEKNKSGVTRLGNGQVIEWWEEIENVPKIFDLNVMSTFEELENLLLSKHKDYGPKNISESPGGPINGLRVRMHDKLARINNLVDSGENPNHESLEDSFKDMANYAVIGLLVLRGQWEGGKNENLWPLQGK